MFDTERNVSNVFHLFINSKIPVINGFVLLDATLVSQIINGLNFNSITELLWNLMFNKFGV